MRKIFILLSVVIFAALINFAAENFRDTFAAENINLAQKKSPQKNLVPANWWESEILTAEGHGAPSQGSKSFEYKKATAKRSAMVDGYRNLAEAAGKIQITAEKNLTQKKIDALVKGAKIISETYDKKGNCTVVLSVPIYGVNDSVARAAFERVNKKNFPAPSQNISAKGTYTGLIIDCGDAELNPILSPTIHSADNQPIYSFNNLDYEKVLANGMVSYAEIFSDLNDEIILTAANGTKNKFAQVGNKILLADAEKNFLRAGNNPLIIKAEALSDDNTCPIISAADADKILAENLASHFLDEGGVVFTSNRIRGMRM